MDWDVGFSSQGLYAYCGFTGLAEILKRQRITIYMLKMNVRPILRAGLEIGIASWNAPPEKVLIYAGFRGFENEKIFEFSPSVLPIFQSGLGEDTTWRVVRVVEGATLEKSCAARHLGFESLTLRQPEKPVLPASLFYSRFPIPKPASIASAEITFELYSRCA